METLLLAPEEAASLPKRLPERLPERDAAFSSDCICRNRARWRTWASSVPVQKSPDAT